MNVRIDLSEIIDELGITADRAGAMARYVLERATTHVYEHWANQARRNLKTTRNDYVRSLRIIEQGRLRNSIVLFGQLNNMIEQGSPPFDMKMALLRSGKAKYDKMGNPYITVPFRHAAPTSIADNPAFSGRLPKSVHSALRTARRQRGSRARLKASEIPSPHNMRRSRAAIAPTAKTPGYAAYLHKSSIYEGLQNVGAKGHTQIMTFRRVSLMSDPGAFIHKGFDPRNFAQKGLNSSDVGNAIEFFVDEFLNSQ
jgi:hypothetical protein